MAAGARLGPRRAPPRLAETIRTHANELAELETRDNGRIIVETTLFDLPACTEMLHYFAGAADKISGDTVQIAPGSFNFTLREPIGVVGIIVPWNAPLSIACAKLGAALAAGNTVVLKPAEQASCSLLRLGELLDDAGVPPGVVNVVAGLGEEAGDALVRDPGVGRISFTGSTDTAHVISGPLRRLAARRLHFELGGKSANIVFEDADLDAAATGVTAMSVFTGNAGQTCIAGSRILVHESIVDEMVKRIAAQCRRWCWVRRSTTPRRWARSSPPSSSTGCVATSVWVRTKAPSCSSAAAREVSCSRTGRRWRTATTWSPRCSAHHTPICASAKRRSSGQWPRSSRSATTITRWRSPTAPGTGSPRSLDPAPRPRPPVRA